MITPCSNIWVCGLHLSQRQLEKLIRKRCDCHTEPLCDNFTRLHGGMCHRGSICCFTLLQLHAAQTWLASDDGCSSMILQLMRRSAADNAISTCYGVSQCVAQRAIQIKLTPASMMACCSRQIVEQQAVQSINSKQMAGSCHLICITAAKAFSLSSTLPMAFMRFLPSFCFSSSFRLREMSPPPTVFPPLTSTSLR